MTSSHGFYRRTGKRIFDLVGSLLLIPLALPAALLVALLVRIGLGPPIVFRQKRIGLGSRSFVLWKFRTMGEERDSRGQPAPDTERMSRLGALLRRASLDELPQLLNVLRGDMSFVGPRPLLPQYLPLYSASQARRHDVRPGLTGLAQVHGRNASTWEERLEFDVEYVKRLSLALDLWILLRTCWTVLFGGGVSAAGHVTMPEFKGVESRLEQDRDV